MMRRSRQWAIAAVLLVNPWTVQWTLQTWWSATPQGQVAQACQDAHLAVIEIGAGATPGSPWWLEAAANARRRAAGWPSRRRARAAGVSDGR